MKYRWLMLWCLLPSLLVEAASTEAVYGRNGMVASRSTLASRAGVEIMQQGGNAVDGAVATAFALAVTWPSAGNISGGGFALVRFPDGSVKTLDHREKAPALAHRDMYLDAEGNVIEQLSTRGQLAAGVPGSVDGLVTLLEAHGRLPLAQVMAPAIRYAAEGFVISEYMARHINGAGRAMFENPAARELFSVNGRPLQAGDLWRQEELAQVLQRIAAHGRDGFYRGRTADLIVAEMERTGGIISHEDLQNYNSVWREPVKTGYRGYEVYTMGPPSSAALVLQMLNMLEPYDVSAMGYGASELIHLMIEVERRAYADRAEHLGDPDYYPAPLGMLLDKGYARRRMADFSPGRASDSADISPGAAPPPESRETTHFSVMDADGLTVAFTTTLNSAYGAKVVVPGTGMLLNNEMDDFSLKPDVMNQFGLVGREANAIAPGKRMLSSMSPTIVTRGGKPYLVTGSPGGATIITTTLQVIVNVLDHGMSLEDAVSLPRFHHQWRPNRILFEKYAISPDARRALDAMGHVGFTEWAWGRGIGDANSILLQDGVMHGVKDPRGEGVAVGF